MRLTLILVHIVCASVVKSKRFIVKTNSTWRGGFYRLSPQVSDDKIVGGWYVNNLKNYSFMVSVMIYKSHQCGGCLLSLNFVVTACHCVAELSEDSYCYAKTLVHMNSNAFSFIAGTTNIEEFDKYVQVGKAKSVHVHPKCQNNRSLIYDHALAVMRKPFFETPFVKPVKMYTWDGNEFRELFQEMFSKEEQPNCVVAGWGDTRKAAVDLSIASPRLKAVRMLVLSEEDCTKAWSYMIPWQFQNFSFWEYGEICTVSQYQDGSDCSGDSGSPYVCDGYLVATVSYGTEDCASGAPSVYATVAELLNWINKDFADAIQMPKTKGMQTSPKQKSALGSLSTEVLVPDAPKKAIRNPGTPKSGESSRGSIPHEHPPMLNIILVIQLVADCWR